MKNLKALLFIAFFTCGIIIDLNAQAFDVQMQENTASPASFPICGSNLLQEQNRKILQYLVQHPELSKANSSLRTAWTFTVGSTHSWYADNFITGLYNDRYLVQSTCRAVGTHCYIFVEDASWTTGRVDSTVVDSIKSYFDSITPANPTKGIYQMDTETFGDPPDVDGDPKIIILLLDIKDGYSGSGGYVAGYFNPLNELDPTVPPYPTTSNFAEIFFIDTNPANLKTRSGLMSGISTLAHEFQHMIHYKYDPVDNELTFINEGCSVTAEVVCGFPIYSQSLYTHETNHSLFVWRTNDNSRVLYDYSRAARFFVYLLDQAGIGIFKKIETSTLRGVAGLNAALQSTSPSLNFNGVLQNWFIANILNDRSVDTAYGYKYPNLPKSVGITFTNPNIASTSDIVYSDAVEYLDFKSGSQLIANFGSGSSDLIIKAIELGSSKRVLDVPKGTAFSEQQFGTSYNEIYFAVMNINANDSLIYTYSTSGAQGTNQTILSYAGSSTGGYLLIPSANQKLAVRFTPTVSGQLYSVSVETGGGIDAIQGSGKLKITACQNISGSVGGIPGTPLGASVEIPFSQLSIGTANDILMQSANVSVTAYTDFQIVIEVDGIAGDSLHIVLDNGSDSTSTRSSSYRIGLKGLGWYNRADSNYGSNKPVSHENILMTATIANSTGVNQPAAGNIPMHYSLGQNYPNPFNPSTIITYSIGAPGHTTLRIFDMLGREVTTLVNENIPAGSYKVEWNAKELPSGVYFYRINTGAFTETRKLVLIK